MAQRKSNEWPRPWEAGEPADPTDWVEQSKRMGTEAPWRQRERERERQEHRAHLRRFSIGIGILAALIGFPVASGIAWGAESAGGAVILEFCAAILAVVIWGIWAFTEE